VGVFKYKEKRSSARKGSLGEDETALWGKGTASKRSSYKYGGIEDKKGGYDTGGVQRV